MDTTDSTATTNILIRDVPEDVARRLKIAAAYENKSRQQWIMEALVIVLNKVEELREADDG